MPPSAIGKRAGATVALECSFPKREPKNSDFARFYMSCVGRKIWGDAAPDAFPRDWEAHWCGGSAEEAVSMRRPTNAILRTAVFISGEIAWHFRATPDMASHLTFGAPRAINMTMRETRNQAFSSNGHPSFSSINFGT
jgi:hypothetical protein